MAKVADFSKHLAQMRAKRGLSFSSLAENISRQLTSTGGRPALEGSAGRKKIPLQSGDWQSLERAVARLQRQGVRSSAGQIASVLLHEQIERLDAPEPTAAGKSRETGRR